MADIYVSSACIRSRNVEQVLEKLAEYGFKKIELTGGLDHDSNMLDRLKHCQKQYDLTFLCHNYFPPPKEDFVLNCASLDDSVYSKSLENILLALRYSKELGAEKFGFHAGYLFDINLKDVGGVVGKAELFDETKALKRFMQAYEKFESLKGNVELYVENNVLSQRNLEVYEGRNPFMMTDLKSYKRMCAWKKLPLLLDVAHLKVSCSSLGLNYFDELSALLPESDYIHISDNDGRADTNLGLKKDCDLINVLSNFDLKDKHITLEIYESEEALKLSYELLERII